MATTQLPQIHNVPIGKIDPSPTNPRKTFSEKTLDELARNIEVHGFVTQLVGREKGKRVQLVFGERRWRAAQRAKPTDKWPGKTIPVVLRNDLNDEEVRELQLSENLQREDLHPMEAAEAYEEILKHPDYTKEKLAARLGKPIKEIKDTLQLCQLITPFRKMFLAGDIGLEQAKHLCRLTPQTQGKMKAAWNDEVPAAKDLGEIITNKVFLSLANAPFSTTDKTLVPAAGACTDCSKRTGFDRTLFSDLLPEQSKRDEDFCLDRPCYRSKTDALIQIKLQPKAGQKPAVPVSTVPRYLTADELKKLPAGLVSLADHFHTLTKKDECGHAEPGVIVLGNGVGENITICRTESCKEHGDHYRGQSYKGHGESPEEREIRLKKDRSEKQQKETRRYLLIHVSKKAPAVLGRMELETLSRSTFNRLYNDLQRKFLQMAGWLGDKKSGESFDDMFSEQIGKLKDPELNQILVMLSLATHMEGNPYGEKTDLLLDFAKRYKVDVKAIEKEVAAKYAPKSKEKDEQPEPQKKAKKAGK